MTLIQHADTGQTTATHYGFERVLARGGFCECAHGRLSRHNANAVEAAVACNVAQLLNGSGIADDGSRGELLLVVR